MSESVVLPAELAEVVKKISEINAAKRALKGLVAAGCNERAILECLYRYCCGTPEEVAGAIRSELHFRKRLSTLADEFRHTADNIVGMISALKDRGWTTYGFDEVPHQLKKFARLLDARHKAYSAKLRKDTSLTQELVYLAYLIKERTGAWHYFDIGAMVSAIRGTAKTSNLKRLEENTGKTIQRFIKDHAEFAEELEAMAVDEVHEWTAGLPHK